MIQLYKPDNGSFEKNGDFALTPVSCESTVTLNGSWEMELIVPATAELVSLVTENSVIKAPSPEFDNDQLWRIYAVDKDNDEIVAQAYPIFLDAKNDCTLVDVRPTGKTGQEALNIMCAANSKYTATTDITKASTAYYIRKNLIEAIGSDDEQSFINRWGGEVLYNNFTAVINERAGGDYGARAELGFNIQGIEEKTDMSEVVTRIIPEAYNGYTLSGNKPWVDSPIINAYPTAFARVIKYSNIKLREDAQENDEENGSVICDTLEELRAALTKAAQQEFENGIDKPHVEYKIDILDLESTREYRDFKDLVKIRLGDVVHVRHKRLGIDIEVRCIGRKYDHAAKRITEITLGNPENNYFDNVSNTIDHIGEVIDPDSGMLIAEKVKGILDAVSTQLRLQSTVAKKVKGRAFEISDLDPESELYGCMIIGSQGLQIATERTADGRDWNWRTAITAKGIIADAIISGLLSDKTGRNYWNLDTGEFKMSMESFTLDGKTIEGITDDILEQAKGYTKTAIEASEGRIALSVSSQINELMHDYVTNGDFADGLTDWTVSDTSVITIVTDTALGKCAKFSGTSTSAYIRQYWKDIKPGTYRVRFKAAADAGDAAKARVRCSFAYSSKYTNAGQIKSGVWTQFEFVYEMTTTASRYLYIYDYVSGVPVYIKDVELLGRYEDYNEAQISVMSNNIELKVAKGDVAGYFTLYYDKVIAAFNDSSKWVQIAAGEISIYDGAVTTSKKRAAFNENGNHFWRDGYEVGKIGTNSWASNSAYRGLVFDLEYQSYYMAWASKDSSAADSYTIRWLYANKTFDTFTKNRLYPGCDIDLQGYKIRNFSVAGAFTIPNNVPCDIYSNMDMHNWELKNVKINNLVAINGYAPRTETIRVVTGINGDSYSWRDLVFVKGALT